MKPESILQKHLYHYLTVSCPEVTAWHVPNSSVMAGFITGLCIKLYGPARGRSYATSAISRFVLFLKSIGLRPGIPDLHLAFAPGRLIMWELKDTNGRVSSDQMAIHARLREAGFKVDIIRSLDDAKASIRQHGIPCRDKFLSLAAALLALTSS